MAKEAARRAKNAPLSGADKTEFDDGVNDMKNECVALLADSYFSGYTGTANSLPVGDDLADWNVTEAENAESIIESTSPSTTEIQEACDNVKTVAVNAPAMIAEYTT